MKPLCTQCHDASCRVAGAKALWRAVYDTDPLSLQTQIAALACPVARDECRARTRRVDDAANRPCSQCRSERCTVLASLTRWRTSTDAADERQTARALADATDACRARTKVGAR